MHKAYFFRVLKKVLAVFMIISIISSAFPINEFITVARADSSQFNVNLSSIGTAWAVSDATISGGQIITTQDGQALIAITIDDVDLQTAIDLGTVSVSSTLNVNVSGLTVVTPDAHNSSLKIRFGTSVATAYSALPSAEDSRESTSDESFSLSVSTGIPSGTRCILLEGSVLTYQDPGDGVVTTTFTSSSTVIPDVAAPTVTASYNSEWTNQDVEVTVTASDAIGVKAIYDGNDNLLTNNSTYTYTVTNEGNNISSFYAVDYAGNVSSTETVTVDNIDLTPPNNIQSPVVSDANWTNQTVTVTFPALSASPDTSPESYMFSSNGTNFFEMSNNIHTVLQEGSQTWTYKIQDEAGNESANTVTATTKYDVTNPSIDTIDTTRVSGENRYAITVSDAHSGIQEVKYAAGNQNALYFDAAGTVLNHPYQIVSTVNQAYTVYVKDNAGNASTQVISAQNILPYLGAINDVTIDEDTSTTIEINASDDTTALQDLVIAAVSSDHSILADASGYYSGGKLYLDISPIANANTGASHIAVTVSCEDSDGEAVNVNFKLYVTSVNDRPTANIDSAGTSQNTEIAVDVLANDTDVEDDVLTIQSFTQGSNGSVAQDGDNLVYTPNADWAGTDTFEYTITDGHLTNSAEVTVTVSNINDAPVAIDDSAQTDEDTAVSINVTDNDSDADLGVDSSESITVTIDSSNEPSLGSVNIVENVIEYTPNANAYGTDTFTYILTDAQGLTDTAYVTVTIESVNDTPVISNYPSDVSVDEDSTDNQFTFNVSDVETAFDTLMVQVVSTDKTLVKNDDISVSLDTVTGICTVVFSPTANKSGSLDLKLILSDGMITVEQLVPITVQSANDAPHAVDDDMTVIWRVYEDTPKSLDLSLLTDNDTDIDGDALTVTAVSSVSSGSLTLTSGQTYTYTPAENYNGAVTFTYTVSDGNQTDTANVVFDVIKRDDAPVLTLSPANVYECEEDNFVNSIVISASDVDTDLSHLIVTVESSNDTLVASKHITVTNNNDGTFNIDLGLTEHKNGSTDLKIYLSDGINTVTETITYTVTPMQDVPVALDDDYTVGRATVTYIIPVYNDFDYDDEELNLLNATSFTQPAEGTLTVKDRGFLYRAPSNTTGIYTFTYTITDGIDEATATVTLNVIETGEIQGPAISAVSDISVMENTSINNVNVTIEDPDGVDTVVVTSSNQSIVNDSSITVNNSGINYTIGMTLLPDVTGVTYITITATDDNGHSSQRQYAVNVYPENETPIANDDLLPLTGATVLAYEDTVYSFTAAELLANDTDAENDELSVIYVSHPSDPYSYITGDGVNYQLHPRSNLNGNITFTYYITDGYTTSSPATVTVYLIPVNDRPDGDNDYYLLANDTGNEVLTIDASGVLTNDDDVENDPLTVDRIGTQPQYGTVQLNADGSFTYTRTQIAPGTYGQDSFTYYVTDGDLVETNPTYVNIQTHYEPDFHIYHRSATKYEDDPQFSISVPVGQSNGYTGTYEITSITNVDLGTAIVGPGSGTNLSILYTPNEGAYGGDSFTYQVTDTDTGRVKTATVYVYLIPVNDAPTFVVAPDSPWEEDEDTSKVFNIQIADSDHDIEDLELEVYLTNQSNSDPIALDSDITVVWDSVDPSKATVTVPFLPNKYGTFTVVFNVSDGIDSTTATANGEVLPVDDPPNTPDRNATLKEDTFISIEIMDYVTDIDTPLSNLVLTISADVSHGSATVVDDEIEYTPDYNYYGPDALTYKVSSLDGLVYSEGQVNFTVEAENDAPYIYDIDYYVVTDEDTQAHVSFMSFDYEDDESTADGNITAYSFTSDNPAVIPVSSISMEVDALDANHKTLTLVPEENKYGVVNLTVSATDSHGAVTTVDFIVNVVPVNDIPNAVDDVATVDEDGFVDIAVLANDTDIEDDASTTDDLKLSVIEVSDSLHGKTSINAQTGVITYTPFADYNGNDSFTYVISDSYGDTASATVNVTVSPVNDAPVAVDDEGHVLEGQTITINLLENDWDKEILDGETADILEIVSVSASTQGATISFEDGILTYTANDDLAVNVVDVLTYIIKDSPAGTSTDEGTITINVEQVNDPPAAENDDGNNIEITSGAWVFDEDTVGVFIVDIADAETYANQLIVSISSDGQSLVADSNITMTNTAEYDKRITLVPFENVFGEFNITFTVSDGEIQTTKVFPVKINPVNDLPQLTVYNLLVLEEQSGTDDADVTDVETTAGDFVFAVTRQASNGTATVNHSTGAYTYTPDNDFTGSDSFEITVTDEHGGQDSETVFVTVSGVNDAPVANEDNYTIDESTDTNFYVMTNDTDADTAYGDSISIVSVTQPDHGAVSIVDDHILYEPEDYNNNNVSYTYTIEDESGAQSTATVNVTITPVDNDPANGNDTYQINEDAALQSFDVLINDDIDTDETLNTVVTDALTLISVTPNTPANSQVCEIAIVDGKQVLSYKPALNFYGTDIVTYTMKDANTPDGEYFTFTAEIEVQSINDLPTISDIADEVSGHNEDNNIVTSADISDIETDADTLIVSAVWDNDTLINRVDISTTGATRTITVVPEGNISGTAIITVKVADEHGGQSTDTFTVTVDAVNDAPNPSLNADTAATDENTTVYIDVLKNDDVDANLEGDTLRIEPGSISLTSAVDYGGTYEIVQRSVERTRLNTDGTTSTINVMRDVIAYTPNADWTEIVNRVQVFSYQMYEESAPLVKYDATDKVEVTITPVNDAPTIDIDLVNDEISMDEDTVGGTGSINVIVNDEEDGNSSLAVTVESITEHEPNSLPDSPLVLLSDITINTTADDSIRELIITSQSDESGVFDVQLKITDSNSAVSFDTVTVTVNPVQDAPADGDDLFTTQEDTPILLDVLANDDVDTSTQGSLSTLLLISTQPSHGSAVIQDNKVLYTPDLDYFNDSEGPLADDSFQYLMRDGNGATATFTVTMYVEPVNDAPVLDFDDDEAPDDNKVTTPESTQRVIKVYVSDVDDIDADLQMTGTSSNPLIVNDAAGGISIGSIQTDAGGSYFEVTLTPFGKWNGTTNLTFTASDPTTRASGTDEAQSIQVVELEITPVNDAPDAIADAVSGDEGNVLFLNVLVNDQDPDFDTNPAGDELSLVSATFAPGETNTHVGTITVNGTKDRVVFSPAVGYEDWNGVLSFTYTVRDIEGLTDSVVSQLTINQVNDAPVANADTGSADEDTFVEIDILSNDTDVDMDANLNNMPYTEYLSIKSGGFAGVDNGTVTIVNSTTIRFTPTADFNGQEVFTYTVLDNNGASDTGTVTVTINPVEDNPTAVYDSTETDEDTAVTIAVLSNDSDTDSDTELNKDLTEINDGTLTITQVNGNDITLGPVSVSNGTVSLDTSGSEHRLIFTPTADFVGQQSFNYTIVNNDGNTDFETVTVTVVNVNDAPTAQPATRTIPEDSAAQTFDVSALIDDIDLDVAANGEVLTISIVSATVAADTTVDNDAKTITYTPQANWNGEFVITYKVVDGDNEAATADITITVVPAEDTPTAAEDTAATAEDTAVTINVLNNDSDTDSDTTLNKNLTALNDGTLTIILVDGNDITSGSVDVGNGTVSLDTSGPEHRLVFTPDADFVGSETFNYTIANNDGNTDFERVTVTVSNVNDIPIALPDDRMIAEDSPAQTFEIAALIDDVDLDVLANGEELTISIDSATVAGDASVDNDAKTITYTPQANWNGEFVITYRVTDKAGLYDTAAITITVNPWEDNPTAMPESVQTDEDTAITIAVLSNDSDIDSDTTLNKDLTEINDGTLNIILVDGDDVVSGSVDVGNGTVSLDTSSPEHRLIFTPDADFVGVESFEYTIVNNDGNKDAATVTVTVRNKNDAPTADDDSITIGEDFGSVTFDTTYMIGDIDLAVPANGEELRVSIDSATVISDVELDTDTGIITYTPQANWNGEFEVVYRVTDKGLLFDTGTITISVIPEDDMPTALDDTANTDEETAVTIYVLSNDSDIDSDTTLNKDLTEINDGILDIVRVNSNPISVGSPVDVGYGIVTLVKNIGEDDRLVFTPTLDFVGDAGFDYTIENEDGNQAMADVIVEVRNVNDAPTAQDTARTIWEDDNAQSFSINALIDDVDLLVSANNEELTVSIDSATVMGDVSFDADTNIVTYTPQRYWNGEFIINYRVTDTDNLYDTGTISITVRAMPNDPVATDDNAETDEETSVTIHVLDNDEDIDSDTTLNKDASEINDGILDIVLVNNELISTSMPVDVGNGVVSLIKEAGQPDRLMYTPKTDYEGFESFSYTIENDDGIRDKASVDVIVRNVNDAPTAQNTTKTIMEGNGEHQFRVDSVGLDLIDDVDLDDIDFNEVLTVSIDSATVMGDVTLDAAQNLITYTAQQDWNGTFEIVYRVTDKGNLHDTGTITITVLPTEDDPTPVNDAAETDEEVSVTIDVLANDYDTDSDPTINKDASAINDGTLEIIQIDWIPISVGNPVHVDNGIVSLIQTPGQPDKLMFTPNQDSVGTFSFYYTVQNSDGRTRATYVDVNVKNVNDAPTAQDDGMTINEDYIPVTFQYDFLIDDVDFYAFGSDEELTVSIHDATVIGDVNLDTNAHEITYTPQRNWNGEFEIIYRVTDKAGLHADGTITIVVNPIEDNPTAQEDTAATAEDTAVTINVLENDSDIDSDTTLNQNLVEINDGVLEIYEVDGWPISVGNPVDIGSGTVSLVETSGLPDKLIFNPSQDFVGLAQFIYGIKNNDGNRSEAFVRVTVSNVNDAPTAQDAARTIDEDAGEQVFNMSSLIDDVDLHVEANNEVLTLSVDSSTVPGDVSVDDALKTITYTPQANWNGVFEITYRVTDKDELFDTAKIIITVNSVGDAPVLSTESYVVNEDEYTALQATQWYSMDVLANDTDIDETTNAAFEDLKITNVSYTEDNVRLVIASDQKSINFQSDENWNGVVNFTYTVTDAYSISRDMASKITVNQVNDQPVAQNDSAITPEDTPITFTIIGNDSDVDTDADLNATPSDDSITINQVDVTGVQHGSISLTNGVLEYTPDTNFNGVENLNYTLYDEHGGESSASIRITVSQVLDNPQASDDGVSLDEDDNFKDIYPLVNDYNPDSDAALNAAPDIRPLSIQSIDLSLVPAGAGTITNMGSYIHYEPDEHYEGTFKIGYTCVNGNGGMDTAEITVYVAQVYDNPVGDDLSPVMNEDTVYIVDLDDYISDVDAGTVFELSIITNGAHGTASIDPVTHELTYTPDKDYNGEDTIVYLVEDNQLLNDTGTIKITINQVNDAPVTEGDSASGDEDTSVAIHVIANDSDIDTYINLNADPSAEKITVKSDGFIGVENGSVEVLEGATSIVFIPDEHWHGTEVFTYTCVDVTGVEVQAEVTVTINPINDAPKYNEYQKSVQEDSQLVYNSSDLVFDPDIASIGDELTFTIITEPQNGILVIKDNSVITYTPNRNFNGDELFTIEVEDSQGKTAIETFNIFVTQVNDTPQAKDDSVTTLEDTAVTIDVLANDTDIDMQRGLNKQPWREDIQILEEGLGEPANGSVYIDPNDSTKLIYEPNENFYGTDRFECTIVDNSGKTSTAYVDVLVEPVVDVPVLIEFITPFAGNAYRSSEIVGSAWSESNPDQIELKYILSFYDGDKWVTIGEALTLDEYQHKLNEYILETDEAQFRVYGVMADGTQTNTIYSDQFIVDNVAPVNTQYNVTKINGIIQPSYIIEISGGQDMIEFEYLYSFNESGPKTTIKNNSFKLDSENTEVCLFAKDRLGNITMIDSVVLSAYKTRPERSEVAGGSIILLGLLLILLIGRYRNITFIFQYADGKSKKIKFYRKRKDRGISVKLKNKLFENAISVEMVMKRKITEKMLGNTVEVLKDDAMLKKVNLPASVEGEFKDTIV